MSLEPETPLTAAARRPHEQAIERTSKVLRRLETNGRPVTYAAVPPRTGSAGPWLYTPA